MHKGIRSEYMAERLSIPPKLMPGSPNIEISGCRTFSMEGHRGILLYSEERIDIMCGKGTVVIEGTGLQLDQMDREKLVVSGTLACIHLEGCGQ